MALRLWWLVMILVVSGRQDNRLLSRTRRGYLKCRTGVTLEIYPDRVVNGTQGNGGKFASLLIAVISGSDGRNVAFLGIQSKAYLCMTSEGKLYGNMGMEKECMFKVLHLPFHYSSYYQVTGRKRKLFIGLTRSGKPKLGRRKMRRTQFIWTKSRHKRAHRIKF